MADSDDKNDGTTKKTLSLKGGPSVGARSGMSRGPARTVVVERKNRVMPHANAPAPSRPSSPSAPSNHAPQRSACRDSGPPPARNTSPNKVPRNPGLSSAEVEARVRVLLEAGARQRALNGLPKEH